MFNMDCMEFMRGLPDKAYDIAIVDPPYGIGASKYKGYGECKYTTYISKEWDDNPPNSEYFDLLYRVSSNQIIWGGNYFSLPTKPSWIIWDKMQPDGVAYGQYELAYNNTSYKGKIFRKSASWNNGGNSSDEAAKRAKARIHPTQKPVALYKWLLRNYAQDGDKIIDTHGGSMSIAIACYDLGFDLDVCELDKDYFAAAKARYEAHVAKYAPANEIPVTSKGELKLF